MENKKPWQSKTLWVAFIMAGLSFVPQIQGVISQNPEIFATVMGLVFAGLRIVTKGKIAIE